MRRVLPVLIVAGLAAACGGGDDAPAPAAIETCDDVAAGAIEAIQSSIDIVDSASNTGEEPDPDAVAEVEELGSALEARAAELGCAEDELAARMAELAEGLEAESVFGQLIIEGLIAGEDAFYDEG